MTISEALSWAKKVLKEKKVEGPEASAEFLLRQILGKDKVFIIAHPGTKLTLLELKKFRSWVRERAKHKPVWYITNKIEFFGQDFYVNQNVLIPRPETELLVERVLNDVKNNKLKVKSVLEVGTGSGVIILSLAKKLDYSSREQSDSRSSSRLRSNNKYYASDISLKALNVAKKNARNLNFSQVIFKKGDLFAPWKGQKFDVILANLPYVPHEDMSTLAFDLIHYEPRTALDGGQEGLEIYERFFDDLKKYLNPGGRVYCEVGYDQGEKIKKILLAVMPKAKVLVLGDYANIDRIVVIET